MPSLRAVSACVTIGALLAACGGADSTPAVRGGAPDPSNAARVHAGLPLPSRVGVPAGWKPKHVQSTDLVIKQAGAIIEDVLIKDANVLVEAPNVTLRRIELEGGHIENWPGGACGNGLLVEDSTIGPPPGRRDGPDSSPALGTGGYTARRVKIWDRSEGFRVGGKSAGCGPVKIESSFARIVIPHGDCALHSDGLQGYDGPPLVLRNTTIDFRKAACGTAPFFVPSDAGNTTVDVDNLLVIGGGYPFRLGVPGTVRRLAVAAHTWAYQPVDVECSLVSSWNADIVSVSPSYRIDRIVKRQSCR